MTRRGGLDDRYLARWRPAGAGVIVRAEARRVSEKDQRLFARGAGGDRRLRLCVPVVKELRIVLPSPVQRELRCEIQPLHQSPGRGFTQAHAEFVENDRTGHELRQCDPTAAAEIPRLITWALNRGRDIILPTNSTEADFGLSCGELGWCSPRARACGDGDHVHARHSAIPGASAASWLLPARVRSTAGGFARYTAGAAVGARAAPVAISLDGPIRTLLDVLMLPIDEGRAGWDCLDRPLCDHQVGRRSTIPRRARELP